MIRLFDKPAPNKNNDNRSVFSIDNNSKLAFGRNNSNSDINKFGISKNGIKYIKKLEKLSKLEKSKSNKTYKS